MADYVLAIDQGTTSSRAIIFDKAGSIVSTGQLEHEQIFPKAGWVEHDPAEIWRNTGEVIGQALGKANLTRHDIAAVGITNQRETAVVWDKPHRRARVQRDRLAGHPHPVDRRPARGRRRRRALQAEGRPAARHLLLGHEDRLDPRERARRAREGRGRRPALRHDRHVGALEPHRRRRRRRARDGCHEREPHDVHGPRDPAVGRRDPRRVRRAALDAARDPLVVRGLRRRERALAAARDADRRHPRRPAGRDLRPGRVRRRRGEEHLRHRQLPDLQHRRGDRPLEERAAHDRRLQARRRSPCTTRSRARSRSPAR